MSDIRPRGRPSSGNAQTAAQRKAAQRQRWIDLTRHPEGGWEAVPLEILGDWLKRAISAGWPELVTDISAEAVRRALLNEYHY